MILPGYNALWRGFRAQTRARLLRLRKLGQLRRYRPYSWKRRAA